jgi:hypothetical protein
MAGSTIDHLVAFTLFLAVILIFIGLFNQTIQTAIQYQQHRYLAAKCSDLIDNILLSTGTPSNETYFWGRSNCAPTSFGLQDPEFTQYRLSPFSLMRLNSIMGKPAFYPKTGLYYSNITLDFGISLFVPFNEVVNYSTARTLLGINNSHGFQLSVTPIITVTVTEEQANPLRLAVKVMGTGSPLSYANISYCLITVEAVGEYPAYDVDYGTAYTNDNGSSLLILGIDGTQTTYALIVYAHMCGLTGVGYYQHATHDSSYVIPLVSDLDKREMGIAHSYDVQGNGSLGELAYNATFVLLTEDFTLREMPIDNCTGKIDSGPGFPFCKITIPTENPGILVVTYKKSASESGSVLMPWGLSAMAFPTVFGENPLVAPGKEWVATDTRQVIVNDIAYSATLALWNLDGYSEVG